MLLDKRMRTILHSDLNSYYASVETVLDPSLKGKAVAVCGSRETRHGIVLAKSDLAKRDGVQTGMAIWEAKQCCPDLLVVPPHYDQYMKYSSLVRGIYKRYTKFIEPYGLDECWLDITGASPETPLELAHEIRRTIRDELGLTVSIGVSFNKVFAKLGSDMKKPDAVTEIPPDSFREVVWPLPAGELLGVGPATQRKLKMRSIQTIGQLAACPPKYLTSWFGKNGHQLWLFANGLDSSKVAPDGYSRIAKSVGHGMTTSKDLDSEEDVRAVLNLLVPGVSRRLRAAQLMARALQITIRCNDLTSQQYQSPLPYPTQSTKEMVQAALALFRCRYDWHLPIMAFTVRAVQLVDEKEPWQLDFFEDTAARQRQEKLERTIEDIQAQFGRDSIRIASALEGRLIDRHPELEFLHMPSHMFMG